jgi:hypothetical protein
MAVTPMADSVEGKRVYALASHRVVLPNGAHHFRRVIACERCGRDLVEHQVPIRHAVDLDVPAHRRLCEGCAQVT